MSFTSNTAAVRDTFRPGRASGDFSYSRRQQTMKILHVLDHFLPVASGYSHRSRYLLQCQRRTLGFQPVVLTSPQHDSAGPAEETWDGMRVYRTPRAAGAAAARGLKELGNMVRLARRVR